MVHITIVEIEKNREKHIYYTNEAWDRRVQGDITARANPYCVFYTYPAGEFEF